MSRFFSWIKRQFKTPSVPRRTIPRKKGELPRLFYLKAIFIPELPLLRMRYSNSLDENYVLTIHTTAGWQKQSGVAFIKSFLERGLNTDFLDQEGNVYQQSHGDKSGAHAGKSSWKGKSNISRYGRGIEVACGGRLGERNGSFYTWFNKEVRNARFVKTDFAKKIHGGWYEPMTDKQEKALAEYIIWWCNQGVKLSNVVSHDWISFKRKTDVGGALSLPLDEWKTKYVKPYIKDKK